MRGLAIRGVLVVALAACSGFKGGGVEGTGDAATPNPGEAGAAGAADATGSDATSPSHEGGSEDATIGAADGGTHYGPGPFGVLPTGYCCASNDECRERNCASNGAGGRICADSCMTDAGCAGFSSGFHCANGSCAPDVQGGACVPKDQFAHGAKPLGACCTATHDVKNGLECLGGRCDSSGDISNPYICTNLCKDAHDCPGNYSCFLVDTFSACVPNPSMCKCTEP